MNGGHPLGAFRRARRERVRPEARGLPAGPRRRVPGLRRAEVAALAGVSTDYYVRLEQGRERAPSAQVVEALAGALGLHRLARPAPARRRRAPRPEPVSPQLLRMMGSWTRTPAVVLGRH